jgi:hypothetical protein
MFRCMLSYLSPDEHAAAGMHKLAGGSGRRFTVQISNDKPFRLGPTPEAAEAAGITRWVHSGNIH